MCIFDGEFVVGVDIVAKEVDPCLGIFPISLTIVWEDGISTIGIDRMLWVNTFVD